MTGELIKDIVSTIHGLNAGYFVEYDEAAAMNVKADTIPNDRGLVFIEEVRRGRYRVPQSASQGYYVSKDTELSIYFCRFSKELQPYASIGDSPASVAAQRTITETRQAIRDRIESEVVTPFVNALIWGRHGVFEGCTFSDFAVSYPYTSRFDSNEVAVVLSFTITQRSSCFGALK